MGESTSQAKLNNSGAALVRVTLTLDRPERCPGPLEQDLLMLKGEPFGPPIDVLSATSYTPISVTLRLQPGTRTYFSASARCRQLEPSGSVIIPGIESPGPFAVRLVQDNASASPAPLFVGPWATNIGGGFSGGTTHEALQAGASATLEPGGFVYALAWVTTRDARHPLGADQDQARAACDRVLCATIPTAWWPSAQMRQVMGAGDFSFFDSDSPSAGAHRLQVIADEDAGVDIDAFLLVEACDDIRATC